MTDGRGTERTLVLLRHAKAERPDGVADRERPLTARGHADAALAGAWLARHGLLPDVVICSPARRTRETWHAAATGMTGDTPATDGLPATDDMPATGGTATGGTATAGAATGGMATAGAATGTAAASAEGGPAGPVPQVRYEPAAYAAETADLLALVRATAPEARTVLLVAHNPGISLLSIALDRVGADREGLRTSGIAVHRVPGGWAGLGTVPAPVTAHHTPRA